MRVSVRRRYRLLTVPAMCVAGVAIAAAMSGCNVGGETCTLQGNAAFTPGLRTQQQAVSYTFTTLNDQADPTFNQLLGINALNVIAGYFGSGAAGHPNKGYLLNPPYAQASYVNENFPGSAQTQVTGIDDKGNTSGFWVTGNLSDPPPSAIPHAGGMNIAYGDGHVKFYRMEIADASAGIVVRHIGDGVFPGQ